jgi:YceI-like domain
MKKHFLSFLLMFAVITTAFSQKYFTRTGTISFYSKAPMENIEAVNKQATCIVDFATNDVAFTVLMKGFQFEKALMQEHFNENYVESDKYPKATFKGKIAEKVDITKEGTYDVNVSGTMNIHGVDNKLQTKGKITVKKGSIVLQAEFNILLKDYKIEIPTVVKDKIASTVKITVNADCPPFKK